MTNGEIIKIARTNSGHSQDDLAEKLGVTKNYISQLENNKKVASVEFLKKIAELYSIPTIVLLWDKMLPQAQTPEEQTIINDLEVLIEKTKHQYVGKYLEKKSKKLRLRSKKHLFMQLGLSEEFVNRIIDNFDNEYSTFSKPDKKGKPRDFTDPHEDLRVIQKRINKLLDRIDFPSSIQGGMKGKSIVSNASLHANKRYVANYDISGFFPSIKSGLVYDAFIAQECTADIARLLTRLTTANGCVPQGFLTSPKISGLVLLNINNRLEKLLAPYGLQFSFWIDDLTISGNYDTKKLEKKIAEIFQYSPFDLNETKTKHTDSRSKQESVGLVINTSPNKDAEYKKKLRSELIALKKYGVDSYIAENYPDLDKAAYLQSLKGRVGFMVQINEANQKFRVLLQDVLDKENA